MNSMKKFLLALAFLLALPLYGGSYTLTTTAPADATLANIVADTNEATCLYYSQAIGCTQAQARKEFCKRAGVGGVTTCVPNVDPTKPPVCTTTTLVATCPGATQVDVYSDVQTFLQREMTWPDYPPVSMPAGAFLVYGPEVGCPSTGNTLPDMVLCRKMRDSAAEYMVNEVSAGRVKPGTKFVACTYPSDPNWPSCIWGAVQRAIPSIRLGMSPAFVDGAIGGIPYTGFAAGVAYADYIRVSIADIGRVYKLCAWETANSLLCYLFDLPNEGDGPITEAATNYACAANGVS